MLFFPEIRVEDVIADAPGADRVLQRPKFISDASVMVPITGSGTISFSYADGSSLTLGLPVIITNLSTNLGNETMVTAQYTYCKGESISARAIVVIPDAKAPSSYNFNVQLPHSVEAIRNDDDSISLVHPTHANIGTSGVKIHFVVAEILPAWAVDANNVSIPTSYSFDGTILTQSIDLSAVTTFPVVADPEVKWMGYFVRLKYSKRETRGMRDQGVIIAGIVGLGAAISAAAGPAAPAIIAAVYAASAAAVTVIATTASNAVSDGKCLQLDIPSMIPSIIRC